MDLLNDVKSVKNWLALKSSWYPFIIGYGAKQWTDLAFKRYPKNVVMNICVLYAEKEGSLGTCGVEEDQYAKSAKKLFSDLKTLDKFYLDFEKDELNFYKSAKKLEKGDIINGFSDFIKAYDDMYVSGITIDGFLAYSDNFMAEMKSKYPNYSQEIQALIEPYGLHFMQKEHLSLLKIALLSKNKKTEDLLKEHHKDFHWIQNNYKYAKGLNIDYFKKALSELLKKSKEEIIQEKEKLENYSKNHKKECLVIKSDNLFEINDYERMLWLGKIAEWVDRRKACNLIANYYIDKYAVEIAKKHRLNYSDIMFLLPWELEDIIAKKKDIQDFPIEERKAKHALIYTKEGNWEMLVGKKAEQVKEMIDPSRSEKTDEIRGMSACKGKIVGRAKVILDPHNQNINEGDILVTSMTRPDFLGLMKKAAAFVTDEGGVTCHAAIIAREMNKPCIIGTRIATKTIKDGNIIEVNANHGKIRIIRSH